MHHSLILKNTSHQSRKNTKHFIHLSNTWICIKATTNKTKFKLSQLLSLEKALAFQEITDVCDRLNFQLWMWNLCLRNFVEGEDVSSTPATQALCKEIVHGSILKLSFSLFL